MHYLIDGYNILFKLFEEGAPLRQQRELLIEHLRRSIPPGASLTLVFDAHSSPNLELRGHYGDLEIVYSSKGETADDWILGRIQRGKAYTFTVITSDKSLMKACRHLGAHAKSISSFFKQLEGKKSEKPEKPSASRHFDYYLRIFENS